MEQNIIKEVTRFFNNKNMHPEIYISIEGDYYLISVVLDDSISRIDFIRLSYCIYNILKQEFILLLFVGHVLKFKYSYIQQYELIDGCLERIVEDIKGLVNIFKGKNRNEKSFLLPFIMQEYSNILSLFNDISLWKEQSIMYNDEE